MKTLSRVQLAQLGALSTRAWKHLCACGATGGTDYEEWRHDFTADHCGGRSSWRTLYQTDYVPLCNAFRAIYGGKQKQDNTPQSDAAALVYTIRDRLAHWETPPAYFAAIVRDKCRRPWVKPGMSVEAMLAGLGETELRQLLYTLEARMRSLTARTAAAADLPAPAEVHRSRSTVPPARLAAARGDIIAAPLPQPRRKPAATLPPCPACTPTK